MPDAVATYFGQPRALGWGLFAFVSLAMAAPYYMAFAAVYPALVRRAGGAAPLLAGAAWAAAELARGRLLNGTLVYVGNSTWATFGYSQAGVDEIVQVASLAGVYGVSFVLVVVNQALADAIARARAPRRPPGLAMAAATAGAALAWGLVVLQSSAARTPAPGDAVEVAIVQADLDAASRWDEGGPARTLDAYGRLTLEAFEAAGRRSSSGRRPRSPSSSSRRSSTRARSAPWRAGATPSSSSARRAPRPAPPPPSTTACT
jgi:apolipoprotein N-acyltransferase